MYLSIKQTIWNSIPFGNDFTHMLAGFGVLLITLVIFRQPMGKWTTLAPVGLISLAMELVDVLLYGQNAAGAARDFVCFCLVPAILVLAFRQGWAKA